MQFRLLIEREDPARLDNRPGRTRNRRYIVPGEQADAADGVRTVIGTRVAHRDHPDATVPHATSSTPP